MVGSGPAGSATAAACAERGLRVVLVAPAPEAPWVPTYGLWQGEADVPFRHRWPEVRVVAVTEQRLARGYGLVDNGALQARLLAAPFARCAATVVGVEHGPEGAVVGLADGGAIRAVVVVDAGGHRSPLLARPARPTPAWQVAHGVVALVDRPPAPPGSCTLMDWTGPADGPVTFLYAMDLGDGRWFLEETSLARRPALGLDVAARRLDERLARLGVRCTDVLETEEVRFPMGTGVPRAQRVVGTGAAGGLVHPATGYSVAASLRAAPVVADALAGALGAGAMPERASAAAWEALWPASARRVRALHQYGLSVVLRMDRARVQRFFEIFFALPGAQWQGYLAGRDDLAVTVQAMRSVFGALDVPTRAMLVTGNPLAAWWAASPPVSGRPR